MTNFYQLPANGRQDSEALAFLLDNFLAVLPIVSFHELLPLIEAAEGELRRRSEEMARTSVREFDGRRISLLRAIETLGITDWPFSCFLGPDVDPQKLKVTINAVDLAERLGLDVDLQAAPVGEIETIAQVDLDTAPDN